MSPEEQMRRFQAGMEEAKLAYTSLTKAFNKAEKVLNLWEAYQHMKQCVEHIGQEEIEAVLRENGALPPPAPPPPLYRSLQGAPDRFADIIPFPVVAPPAPPSP